MISKNDQDNITKAFDQILNKDNLQESLHIKCLPKLMRGLEDGIFECMIPMAFLTKTKNVFQSLTESIDTLYCDAINFFRESGFGNEIVMKCVNQIHLMAFIHNKSCLTMREIDNLLKIEKK